MHFTASIAAAIMAFAATAAALPESSQGVLNNCHESVWVTFTNSTKDTTGPLELKTGGGWASGIVGSANSLGISKNDQFYSNETAKLILGTTTDKRTLYWTVSDVNGDPFDHESWSLNSTDVYGHGGVCQNATIYDGQVHACADNGVELVLYLC